MLVRLHPRSVEWQLPASTRPVRTRALPGGVLGAVLVQQHLDAPVRGGLECLLPAGSGASVFARPPRASARACCLLLLAPVLEHRTGNLEQLGRGRMRPRLRPADDGPSHLVRQEILQLPFVSSEQTMTTRGPRIRRPLPVELVGDAHAGGPGRASRCAAGSSPATSRLDRADRAAARNGRRWRPACRAGAETAVPARVRRAPRSRPRRDRRAERAARGRSPARP